MSTPSTSAAALGARAADEALAAAIAAEVVIAAMAVPDELDELRATMESVWGPEVVIPRNALRGLALGGAGLLVARRGDDNLGFALGWLGWTGGVHFHSHQVGVRAGLRSTGIGAALKLAQRAQCLAHGITEMRWTFDPLLAKNARFNLVRLGAQVVDFFPNCYGERRDAFNTGDVTDRVEVSWALDRAVGGALVDPQHRQVIAIPADYHQLRLDDRATADDVRRQVGAVFGAAFGDGRRIVGLCHTGDAPSTTVGYVVQ